MQLTMEQRIFIVKLYYKMKSYNQNQTHFRILFWEHLLPSRTTIWKNVKRYERDSTSLKMNKGRSRRRITTKTKENIEAVQQALEGNQGIISARRHGLGIPPSSICQIIKIDLHLDLFKIIRHHNLKDGDYERCFFSVLFASIRIEGS